MNDYYVSGNSRKDKIRCFFEKLGIRFGVYRIVFLFGNYVIKIPNLIYDHRHFIYGCYCNYNERISYKIWKKQGCRVVRDNTGGNDDYLHELVAPSLYCSWFGFLQIQKRCIILERELTIGEKMRFKIVCKDIKPDNFGIINEKVVCLDYS
jgi:hypothetical protein